MSVAGTGATLTEPGGRRAAFGCRRKSAPTCAHAGERRSRDRAGRRPGGRARRRPRLALQRRRPRLGTDLGADRRPARGGARVRLPRPARGAASAPRRIPPGPEDADLGFGELVEDETGPLPPAARPPRAARPPARLGSGRGVAGRSSSSPRPERPRATWPASRTRGTDTTRSALHVRGSRIAATPGADPLRRAATPSPAPAATPSASRSRVPGSPTSTRRSAARSTTWRRGGDRRGDQRTADALVVLAHEAVHLGGERREGVTECLALQEAGPLALRLGLPEATARRILRTALAERLSERNVIRAAYALPAKLPRRGRARPQRPRTRASPSSPSAASSRRRTRATLGRPELLAEHGRAERVRLDDDALPLRLERAAHDEQRGANAAPPVVELGQGLARCAALAVAVTRLIAPPLGRDAYRRLSQPRLSPLAARTPPR